MPVSVLLDVLAGVIFTFSTSQVQVCIISNMDLQSLYLVYLLLPPHPIFHQVWQSSTLPPVIAIPIFLCTLLNYPASNEVPSNKD